jgi:hypothetical protein
MIEGKDEKASEVRELCIYNQDMPGSNIRHVRSVLRLENIV